MKRMKPLRYSLALESFSSQLLGYYLDVSKVKESNSFGNKSSSLSFNQKMNLLLDSESISKDEKKKFDAFMNIRNQFIHNEEANTYVESVKRIEGLEIFLKKIYPMLFTEDLERSLEKCLDALYKDCFNILSHFKGGIKNKLKLQADAKFHEEFHTKLSQSFQKNIKEALESLEMSKSKTFSKEQIKAVLNTLRYEVSLNVFNKSLFKK